MFRTLGRILSLVFVTGLVAGGIYYLVNANPSRGASPGASPGERRTESGAREGAAPGSGPGVAPGATAAGPGAPGHASVRQEPRARDGHGRRGWDRGRSRAEGLDRDREGDGPGGRGVWREEGRIGRDGRDGHGGHGEFSPGRGTVGLLMTTVQVALVAALVVGLHRLLERRRQGPPTGGQPA